MLTFFFRRWRNERSSERILAQGHGRHSVAFIVEARYSILGREVCSCYQIEKHEPYNNDSNDGAKWREALEQTDATPNRKASPCGTIFSARLLQSTRNEQAMFCEIKMRQGNVYVPGLIGSSRAEVCLPRSPQSMLTCGEDTEY